METKEGFIVVDIDECVGCGNCLMICHLNDIIDTKIAYGKKQSNSLFRVINGLINRDNICYNCTDAPCIEACDKHILKKDDNSLVYIDLGVDLDNISEEDFDKLKICADCHKKCIEACPTKELFLVQIKCNDKKVSVPIKCDLCGGDPECVKVCPTGAIKYVNISKINFENKKKHAEILAKVSKLID
ncbi:MAG: hypothetical protein ACTSPY_09705 [Candidatus Helarchaeota archaeon]